LYHDWETQTPPDHFDDITTWDELDSFIRSRVRHLLGTIENPAMQQWWGNRELRPGVTNAAFEEYQRYSGVNFLKRHLSSQLSEARLPALCQKRKHKQKFRIMTKALDTHKPHKVFECPGGWCMTTSCPKTCTERFTLRLRDGLRTDQHARWRVKKVLAHP
jgi:hypothetical protein